MASPQHLGVALALGLLLPRDEDDMDDEEDRAPRPRVELLLVRGLSRPSDGSDGGASLHVLQQRATFEVSSTSRAPARESS